MDQQFCLDTGVFINSWVKHYPPDLFPSVWKCIGQLCDDTCAIIPRPVYEEVKLGGDELFDWLKQHKSMVHEPDAEVLKALKSIMASHAKLAKEKGKRSAADAWVIAHAQVANAIVVTEEREGSVKTPKIPDVCKALGIPYMNTVELLRSRGFRS